MFILITYDVNTADADGRRRLRRVAKQCINYGVRVQNSVFECKADYGEWRILKEKIKKEIDPTHDSLRFYIIGNPKKIRIENYGVKNPINVDDPLIF